MNKTILSALAALAFVAIPAQAEPAKSETIAGVARGDIPSMVEYVLSGATTVLEDPVDMEELPRSISVCEKAKGQFHATLNSEGYFFSCGKDLSDGKEISITVQRGTGSLRLEIRPSSWPRKAWSF